MVACKLLTLSELHTNATLGDTSKGDAPNHVLRLPKVS